METPPVQYVTTSDGFNIAYTVCGEGQPFVWASEVFSHLRLDWLSPRRSAFEQLAQRFRFVKYDGRGQGMSTRGPTTDFSLDDDVSDLEAIMDGTGIERAVLFGSTYWGHVALRYAVKHPERVRALILWNSRVDASGRSGSLDVMPSENWDLFVDATARVGSSLQDPESAKHRIRDSVTQADFLTRLKPVQRSSIAGIVASVCGPVLVLATPGMAFVSEQWSIQLAAILPGSHLVVIDHADGGLNSDEPGPKLAIEAIDSFLAGLRKEDGSSPVAPAWTGAALHGLTRREIEVLRLVASGKSSREIGDDLSLSVRTVERHVANIYLKTETHGRAQLATYALRNNLS